MGQRAYMTLDRLAELPPAELKVEWARRYGAPPPKLPPGIMRLGVGYKLQKLRHGGVSRATRALLRAAAQTGSGGITTSPARKLTPGTRLVRDWHGVGHTVIVREDGFEFDGQVWKSLTGVAKAITGSHWNGPRFFGLTGSKK